MKLSKNTILTFGIFAAIILGIVFDSIDILKSAIPYILASLLFFNFLKIDFKLKHFFRKELLYFPIVFYILLPPIIYFAASSLDYNFKLGLFILTITPTAIGAPVVAGLIKGDRELVTAQVLLLNLLSPLTYSLLIYFWFDTANVNIPVFLILKKVSFIILLPLAFSYVIRKFSFNKKHLYNFSTVYVPFAFLLIIFSAVSSASAKLKSTPPETLVLLIIIVFLMALLFFSGGFIFFRSSGIAKSVSLMSGHRNTALSIWIILSNFSAEAVLPLIIYIISHHICNALLLYHSKHNF